MIDIHSHLLPGIDDGAQNWDETRASLGLMREQGVRRLVTTPHLSAGLIGRPAELASYLAQIDVAWEEMKRIAAAEYPELTVERGLEVALDAPAPDLSDDRIRLAGSQWVLVEFPFLSIPPNSSRAIFELKLKGFRPIIAHPERYRNLPGAEAVDEWRSVGGLLQVNCGSVIGRYGEKARELSWSFLERGWVDFLSSDYHARGSLHVQRCRETLLERGAEEQVRLLMEENAARILAGEEPHEVPPLPEKRSVWRRFIGR